MKLLKKIGMLGISAIVCCNVASAHNEGAADAEKNAKLFDSIKDDARPLSILGPAGEIFRFTRTGASTCGKYLLAKAIIPPGAGPLPHVHHWTDEWFYTPRNGIVMYMGTQPYPDVNNPPDRSGGDELHLITMGDGQLFYGGRNYVHGFINQTEKSLELYFVWTPDTPEKSILHYFKEVGKILDEKDTNLFINPISKMKFVSEAPKYGINQSHDFWQYVKSVKYEGSHADSHYEELATLLRLGDESCLSKE